MVAVNLVKPKHYESVSFTRSDLVKIGAKAIEQITKRVARGQNMKDRSAKPLSKRWRTKKESIGQPGIRNLMYSGSMLGALTITEASQNRIVIGFTRKAEHDKAMANQNREPWFGLSKNDEAVVLNYAERLLRAKTRNED